MKRIITVSLIAYLAITAIASGQSQDNEYRLEIQTHLGKGIAGIRDVDVDAEGNIYATGGANGSPDLPGSVQPKFGGRQDVIVLKISRDHLSVSIATATLSPSEAPIRPI